MSSLFERTLQAAAPRTIWKAALAHKFISAVVLVAVIVGGYVAYSSLTSMSGKTSYVLGTATTGTIVSTVSASGSVSASDQIDIKAKVSGEVTWVGVQAGDVVRQGQALLGFDDTTARQAVADQQKSLEQAQLQYQKDTAQAPVDYQNALDAFQTAKDTLASEYTNTFNTFSNTYLDLPNVTTGAQQIIFGYDLSPTANERNADVLVNMFLNDDRTTIQPFAASAATDYATAKTKYDASLLAYQGLSRSAPTDEVDATLSQTIDTTTAVAQALQSELNFLGKVNDLATKNNIKLPTAFTTLQTNARNYLSTTNNDLNALLAEKKALDADKSAVKTDQQNITLLQVGNGTGDNPLSLQISKSSLDKQAQDLANAQANLADYIVVAPFDGTIASVAVHKGDIPSGSVATIVSKNDVATLSLNEVDVAKIKVGDKATLTFDAIDGLSLTGQIAEIDTVGAISQGVVSYNVKIEFTAQDARVKPGMTVNAAIQTDVKQNIVMVPTSAVKTQNGQSYVLVFTPPLQNTGGTSGVTSNTVPAQVPVQTGISDDTNIEITSGVTDGEQVVVRTITASATSAKTPATTGARTGGGLGGGGGAVFRAAF